jgi:hypothetical protein
MERGTVITSALMNSDVPRLSNVVKQSCGLAVENAPLLKPVE